MIFKRGRSNLACTIFVPFDCTNKCPFCNSKEMYSKIDKNLDLIIERIKVLNESDFFNEYVITGGEPTANLEELKMIIDACEKPVYINTTLPKFDNLNKIIYYINNEPKIKGINISRHIGFKFPNGAELEDIDLIQKPIRINTVINPLFDFDEFLDFCRYWGKSSKRMINLRADYTTIDNFTLKNRDDICDKLLTVADNIGNGGCMVCHENEFIYDGILISYHRGLKNSSFKINDELMFINDIIITPDGNVYPDWDFVENKEFCQDLGL